MRPSSSGRDGGVVPMRTEGGGVPLACGGDPTVRDRVIGGVDRQLTLALVHIQAYDLHGGRPPGVRHVAARR